MLWRGDGSYKNGLREAGSQPHLDLTRFSFLGAPHKEAMTTMSAAAAYHSPSACTLLSRFSCELAHEGAKHGALQGREAGATCEKTISVLYSMHFDNRIE